MFHKDEVLEMKEEMQKIIEAKFEESKQNKMIFTTDDNR